MLSKSKFLLNLLLLQKVYFLSVISKHIIVSMVGILP